MATGVYTEYRRFGFFSERAALLRERYPSARTVLVVGCGPGYLVDELRRAGVDAWGIDPAPDALAPRIADRIVTGDAARRGDLERLAPLDQGGRFDLAVTEDVLPCLSAQKRTALLRAVRRHADALLHIVTPGDPGDPAKLPGVDWKRIAGPGSWRAVLGPGEPILNAENWEVAE